MTSSYAPQQLQTAPESSFLERLNAVEEELDGSSAYTFNQVAVPPTHHLPAHLHTRLSLPTYLPTYFCFSVL